MTRTLKLHDLAPSPNNIKVRLALGYKKIPYERIPVQPGSDRADLVRLSGQPLSPVIEHGDTVLFDSGAILRYLEANFLDTPRLYSERRDEMKKIEEWEHWAGHEPAKSVGSCFAQLRAAQPDTEVLVKARAMLHTAADRIEATLADSDTLIPGRITAADIVIAPCLSLGMITEPELQQMPFLKFFVEHFRLEGHPRTRDWVGRLMAYDRPV